MSNVLIYPDVLISCIFCHYSARSGVGSAPALGDGQPAIVFYSGNHPVSFGIGAQPHLLQAIAPGIIWVSALLAAMLSLDSLFRSDFDDGSLEQILLSRILHRYLFWVKSSPTGW